MSIPLPTPPGAVRGQRTDNNDNNNNNNNNMKKVWLATVRKIDQNIESLCYLSCDFTSV